MSNQNELNGFHYKQELKRTLKLFSSFAVAFSFISITTGIFTNYGFVLGTSGPAGIWTWPIVTIGHLLIALIFAELAGRIPISGYSYQWVSRIANRGLGWFSGWIAFCFLMLVVPTVNYGLAPIVGEMFGFGTSKTTLATIVIVTLIIQALINIFGVKLATRINDAAVYTEVIGMIGIIIIIGAVVIFGNADWSMLVNTGDGLAREGSYLGAFILAALMGSYTIVGFEAAANLSEETVNAKVNVPKAIILSVLLSGIIGFIFLIVISIAIPDLAAATNSANPIPYVLQHYLGKTTANLFLVLVIISIFACGLIIMASASRLIFAMSRDNVFYGAKVFKKVSEGGSVPTNAILLVLGLGIIAVLFADSLTLLVGATAVLPAILYLITVCAYARKSKDLPPTDSFTLGKWRKPVTYLTIIWLVIEIGILTIPSAFHQVAIVAGILMLVGVILYFISFRKNMLAGKIGIKE
ncbi:amino acid transporter [Bacillus mesophilus]|uniref:Amino acid permease n=1 Tax=Bacillus mesophilus TaxID=1808955 RepID=A0A6M0QCL4_9BACI|nr:amino acid permease [Bacillus mesophilus]MBM7662869.1 amino acid transporter [Bacillus mesophilus]NEY73459.1 amino acid permease [Bacillus mesophilus]